MFRRPLDLLVAVGRPGITGRKLPLMGAAVAEVLADQIVPLLKLGPRVADAIVLESTNTNPLAGNTALALLQLAQAIHDLEDSVTMPTGTRWNGIPIIVLVDDQATADAIAADPRYRFVTPVSLGRFDFEYYDYIDPWISIYDRIDRAVLENTLTRLAEMEAIGHRFQVIGGRWLRFIPPSLAKKAGFAPDLQTVLYDGRADRFLNRRRELDDEWRGRDVVHLEHQAIEKDLDEYERLVRNHHTESEMQRFYRERPYILGAGAFETTDHPAFRIDGRERPVFPDFIQHSFNAAIIPKPARVIELKTNKEPIISRRGLDWAWGRASAFGINQSRRYTEHMSAPEYRSQMEALFGEAPERVERMVITGTASRHDRERLDWVKKYDPDVEVRGYDEMFESAVGRYATVLQDDEQVSFPALAFRKARVRNGRRRQRYG